ncbi:hypothetical protein TBR22_A12590 [Luteitalea sp. TBR-22]|uniref:hypothetical protein n=1 Tax=Luteitalea sp. TBR-22 TaxID=2802971 RepID=UPI001AF272AF|nr:hypothetical protein [Luteitalea sp. TBR-22]BCS32054.1 hypothetical protein TBR22_A12590 [Luteitalea sp. TBR-22]
MTAHTTVPFVDTNIIPDRNVGIGSLLWDLQHPGDAGRDEPPLLGPAFAFIDVGVSRAQVAVALKTLLADDFAMDVEYVATERPEAVPAASVWLVGEPGETVRRSVARMISTTQTARDVDDWYFVVDREGTVASVTYCYELHGNEVWEAYFMGRPFMHEGERVAFSDPELDALLAADVMRIEAGMAREQQAHALRRPAPSWEGYRVQWNPLQKGLAECGIVLQATDVPRRVPGRQNVLFLGNVLNHYPRDERARHFERITADMHEDDLIVVQMDGIETPSIDVFHLARHGGGVRRERVRWINTRTLEVRRRAPDSRAWQLLHLEPEVRQLVRRLVEDFCRSHGVGEADVHGRISHVLRTFFRAAPVDATRRIAIQEAARRLSADAARC